MTLAGPEKFCLLERARDNIRVFLEQMSRRCNSHITLGRVHAVVQRLDGHPANRQPPLKPKQQIHVKPSMLYENMSSIKKYRKTNKVDE